MRIGSSSVQRHFLMTLLAVTLACPMMSANLMGQDNDSESARQRGRDLFRRVTRNDKARDANEVLVAFTDSVAECTDSTVSLFSGRRPVALGTIVSADGLIVTKASELRGDIRCRFADGSESIPSIVGLDRMEDVALLKVDRDNLVPVNFVVDANPQPGSWLISASPNGQPLSVGVVSVAARPIAPPKGVLGVFLDDADGASGALISQVIPNSPAASAGLQIADVVFDADGHKVVDRPSLQEVVGKMRPGEIVKLKVRRGMEDLDIAIELGDFYVFDPTSSRSRQQNQLGGPLNDIRAGFSQALQHDSGIPANQCGGPVLDLAGEVVGINIARAGRVDSYALSSSVLMPLIDRLKTGEYAPSVVNADRIEKLRLDIAALQNKLESELRPNHVKYNMEIETIKSQEADVDTQQAKGELNRDEALSKLEELENQRFDLEKHKRVARVRVRKAEQQIEEWQEEIQFLASGLRS